MSKKKLAKTATKTTKPRKPRTQTTRTIATQTTSSGRTLPATIVGRKLREARLRLAVAQHEIATLIGVGGNPTSQQAIISGWEHGYRPIEVTPAQHDALAQLIDVEPSALTAMLRDDQQTREAWRRSIRMRASTASKVARKAAQEARQDATKSAPAPGAPPEPRNERHEAPSAPQQASARPVPFAVTPDKILDCAILLVALPPSLEDVDVATLRQFVRDVRDAEERVRKLLA